MGIRLIEKLITFLFDVTAIMVAFYVTVWLRYYSSVFPETYNPHIDLSSYVIPSLVLTTMWIALFFFTGLYREWYKESRLDEFLVVAKTILFGMFCLFLVTSAPQILDFAKNGDWRILLTRTKFATLFSYGGSTLFFATLNRFAIHSLLAFMFRRGIAVNKVLIIGANTSGERLVKEINAYAKLGCRVEGFIDDDGRKKALPSPAIRSWGPIPICRR